MARALLGERDEQPLPLHLLPAAPGHLHRTALHKERIADRARVGERPVLTLPDDARLAEAVRAHGERDLRVRGRFDEGENPADGDKFAVRGRRLGVLPPRADLHLPRPERHAVERRRAEIRLFDREGVSAAVRQQNARAALRREGEGVGQRTDEAPSGGGLQRHGDLRPFQHQAPLQGIDGPRRTERKREGGFGYPHGGHVRDLRPLLRQLPPEASVPHIRHRERRRPPVEGHTQGGVGEDEVGCRRRFAAVRREEK